MKSLDEMKRDAVREFDSQVAQLFAGDPKMNVRKVAVTLNCKYHLVYKSCIRQGIELKQARR